MLILFTSPVNALADTRAQILATFEPTFTQVDEVSCALGTMQQLPEAERASR
jgi:hypothetical protein